MTKRIIQYAFIATLIALGYLVFSVIVEPLHRAKAVQAKPAESEFAK